MKIYFEARKLLSHLVVLCSAVLFAAACGDDDNPEPTKPPPVADDDAGSSEPPDETVDTDATDPTDTDPVTNDPAPGPTAGDAGAGTTPTSVPDGGATSVDVPTDDGGVNTEGPSGCVENDEPCFSCPSTPEQFLKQCSDSECAAFDNARLGRFVPGEALPTP